MNKKTTLIIAIVLLLAGLAATGNGIFWQTAISDVQQRWDKNHQEAGELLKKSGDAQAANSPDAPQLLADLEKANRYVKYAENDRDDATGERNLYLGIGFPLLVIGLFAFMKSRKK